MLLSHARAILWAQLRSLINFYSRGNTGMLVFTVAMSALWYGLLSFGGFSAAMVTADPRHLPMLRRSGSAVLFFMFLYWQVVPILLASTGAGIDLKRVAVYPVSRRELFLLEVLLRLTTGVDMLIVLIGAFIGMAMNPAVAWGKPLLLFPWVAFNLLLATGLRDLLSRLLARRKGREVAMIGFVILAALPQLLLMSGMPEWMRGLQGRLEFSWWPWKVTARLLTGPLQWADAAMLGFWTAGAGWFGWRQFQRGFRFDSDEARATPAGGEGSGLLAGWAERVYRLPGWLFGDPLAAIVEKELRFLSRAPRFRIVFLMGFSFGLLIWLPMAFRGGRDSTGFFAANYLTLVSAYALLLLGEVSFWNVFGFDRGAVLNYFVLPVKFSRVLIAKNIAAAVFVFLEVGAIAAVCFLLRVPITGTKVAEAYAVTGVMTLLLLAAGNLGSVHYPRPVNPAHSWRSASAGRFQAFLMLLYPVVSIPVVLAYLARYAFQTEWAFAGVLAIGAAIGAAVYWVALESAVAAAEERREQMLTALSAGDGPVTV
jgi:ABC-2 type transport system permease protein